MAKESSVDLMKFVGGKFWSRESYIKEAKRLGCCLRIGILPLEIVIEKSKVFLVSDLSEEQRKKYLDEKRRRRRERRNARKEGKRVSFKGQKLERGGAYVFAYFVIRGIAYIVGKSVDLPEELAARGVKEYEYVPGAFGFNDERECGSLMIGGTYLLSEEDLKKVADLVQSTQMEGHIVVLKKPILVQGLKRFRGFKKVRGNAILKGRPKVEWW